MVGHVQIKCFDTQTAVNDFLREKPAHSIMDIKPYSYPNRIEGEVTLLPAFCVIYLEAIQ